MISSACILQNVNSSADAIAGLFFGGGPTASPAWKCSVQAVIPSPRATPVFIYHSMPCFSIKSIEKVRVLDKVAFSAVASSLGRVGNVAITSHPLASGLIGNGNYGRSPAPVVSRMSMVLQFQFQSCEFGGSLSAGPCWKCSAHHFILEYRTDCK